MRDWKLLNKKNILNNQWTKKEIKGEVRKFLETKKKKKKKHNIPESVVCSKGHSKREVYSNKNLQ